MFARTTFLMNQTVMCVARKQWNRMNAFEKMSRIYNVEEQTKEWTAPVGLLCNSKTFTKEIIEPTWISCRAETAYVNAVTVQSLENSQFMSQLILDSLGDCWIECSLCIVCNPYWRIQRPWIVLVLVSTLAPPFNVIWFNPQPSVPPIDLQLYFYGSFWSLWVV